MKRRDIKVVTFETGHEDFLVDAVDKYDITAQEAVYEAWIYRESMGMKMMIYGLNARAYDGSFEDFCEYLEGDDFDEYYRPYNRKTESEVL